METAHRQTKPKTDWVKIKAEYSTGMASQRDLAKKYGVSVSAVAMRCKRENWTKDRDAVERIVSERIIEQTAHMVISNNERAMKMTNELLLKIEDSIHACNKKDVGAIKSLVQSLKDLKELGVFRIDEANNDVKIEISEEAEDYAD